MIPFNLEEYLADPSRKVISGEGKNVKIYCTNCIGEHPIVAEIEGFGFSSLFDKCGKCRGDELPMYNLFFASEKHVGWINIYKNPSGYVFPSHIFKTKEDAEKTGKECQGYIKTSKIEWEE